LSSTKRIDSSSRPSIANGVLANTGVDRTGYILDRVVSAFPTRLRLTATDTHPEVGIP
jgi:hypothetical protein